jgi:hypothetical protein
VRINPQFVSSDRWILLTIAWAGRGVPAALSAVIGMADAINHAIPIVEELDGALNRLLAASRCNSETESASDRRIQAEPSAAAGGGRDAGSSEFTVSQRPLLLNGVVRRRGWALEGSHS